VVDRLAAAQRDIAIPEREVAGEVDRDVLDDEQGAVVGNPDLDVRRRQAERFLGVRDGRRRKSGEDRDEAEKLLQVANCTRGASRVTSSVSK
jgi:hypothetical protein